MLSRSTSPFYVLAAYLLLVACGPPVSVNTHVPGTYSLDPETNRCGLNSLEFSTDTISYFVNGQIVSTLNVKDIARYENTDGLSGFTTYSTLVLAEDEHSRSGNIIYVLQSETETRESVGLRGHIYYVPTSTMPEAEKVNALIASRDAEISMYLVPCEHSTAEQSSS